MNPSPMCGGSIPPPYFGRVKNNPNSITSLMLSHHKMSPLPSHQPPSIPFTTASTLFTVTGVCVQFTVYYFV